MDLKGINEVKGIVKFTQRVKNKELLFTQEIPTIMQLNIGYICNLACKHCHHNAGPNRVKEVVTKDVLDATLKVMEDNNIRILDITGGAPEMMPDVRSFLKKASKITDKIILRTNLVILEEDGYRDLLELFKELKINLVCSLPSYKEKITNKQRGQGVFLSSIRVLKKLNELGYGKDEGLILDLVFNPNGAILPPNQSSMEREYKAKLFEDYNLVFNNLYTLTNNPIGRFGDFLKRSDNLDGYLKLLSNTYNEATVENLMCRNTLSIRYDGYIYDCDFNQAIDAKVLGDRKTIFDIRDKGFTVRPIVCANHCYACTAGAGSS